MHFIAFSFFVICRWSFGVVLYEIFTVGTSESSKYITVLSLKKKELFCMDWGNGDRIAAVFKYVFDEVDIVRFVLRQ